MFSLRFFYTAKWNFGSFGPEDLGTLRFGIHHFSQCLHFLRCCTKVAEVYSKRWEMLWFSKWTESVLTSSQLGRKELILNLGRPTNKSSLIRFWKHRKGILRPSPVGWSGPCRDFIPSPRVSLLWLSGSQCGDFYLWVKPGALWMQQSGRSVSLEFL